ncbi:unnamed protein product [Cladocopium goreaui]|uniref:C3H1-type domain-containing protein n=1 Tax=Cladocopium goreaui TaxID=2562237 RepID=A0A9P1BJW0_9DINO|nr:unnamed protein product [Cladocopium goreaui]
MDVQEEETQGNMEVTTEDPDLPRGGLGFSAGESGSYPDAGQVPLAPKAEGSGTSPPGFVRPMVQPMVLQPVRFMLDPENHAFSKLVAFRASYPSISQLLGEYAPIMHRGGADGLILPLHAPAPVRSGCPMKALRGRSKDGLGAATLKTRKGTKVPYEPPSASYTMEGIVWNLVPLDGKPTWVQSPDTAKGAVGPESDVGTSSKFAKSIDAIQFAQAPAATCSLDEVTMADVVPMALRMSMREEVLGTRTPRRLPNFSLSRSATSRPDKALDIQSKAIHKADQDDEEGMHSVADSEAYSKGVEMLRKTNLEILRQKMKESLLDNQSNTLEAIVQMTAPKHTLVLEFLELVIQNTAMTMTSKAIERALGRLQWATAVCPLTKNLKQPFCALKMAVTSSGRPPKTVRLLALLMKFPRAFKDGNPKKRIAALELLGTLVLTHCVLKLQGKTASAVKIPVGSDNQSSVFSSYQSRLFWNSGYFDLAHLVANVQTPGLQPTAEDVEEEHQKLQYEHLPLPQIQKLVAGMESLEMFPSMGSLGHPFTCASPCRHFLEGNCQDGALCAFCHRCNPMSLQSTPLACGQRFYL